MHGKANTRYIPTATLRATFQHSLGTTCDSCERVELSWQHRPETQRVSCLAFVKETTRKCVQTRAVTGWSGWQTRSVLHVRMMLRCANEVALQLKRT
jgi:hypothetical protein